MMAQCMAASAPTDKASMAVKRLLIFQGCQKKRDQ
jgi:hypothetical protein